MVVRLIGGGGSGNDGTGPSKQRELSRAQPLTRPGAQPQPQALRRESTRETRESREHKVDELPPIPEKIYFRIGEVSHLVGVEPHVLRYWEQEFRSIKPVKSQRGQRVYSRRDVEHLRRIRGLLYEQGFTIAGAKKVLRAKGAEPREDNDPAILASTRAREALVEIRHDVEVFLRELGG